MLGLEAHDFLHQHRQVEVLQNDRFLRLSLHLFEEVFEDEEGVWIDLGLLKQVLEMKEDALLYPLDDLLEELLQLLLHSLVLGELLSQLFSANHQLVGQFNDIL